MTTSNEMTSSAEAQRKRGFTLVEIMLSMGILVIALAVILPTFITFSKYMMSLGNYLAMSHDSRKTVELIARDVRGADELIAATSTAIQLILPADAGSQTVTYSYDAAQSVFTGL